MTPTEREAAIWAEVARHFVMTPEVETHLGIPAGISLSDARTFIGQKLAFGEILPSQLKEAIGMMPEPHRSQAREVLVTLVEECGKSLLREKSHAARQNVETEPADYVITPDPNRTTLRGSNGSY